jgi:predicted kinase
MRGIPGSGKSTVAERIAKGLEQHSFFSREKGICSGKARIHSTDNYFMVDGEYRFDPTKLGEYHKTNFEAFKESVATGYPVVICDNTNTTKWEYERYQKAAEEAGYIVSIISMPHPEPEVAAERNSHGVPLEAIKRMLKRWEP